MKFFFIFKQMVTSINKCNPVKYGNISIYSLYPNKPLNFFIRHIISLLQGHVYYSTTFQWIWYWS